MLVIKIGRRGSRGLYGTYVGEVPVAVVCPALPAPVVGLPPAVDSPSSRSVKGEPTNGPAWRAVITPGCISSKTAAGR